MKLIIDIPEEEYKKAIRGWFEIDIFKQAVKKGTPLPKGHGKLIDADKTLKNAEKIYNAPNIKDIINPAQMYAIRKILTTAPTIIEADKENG